MSDSPKNQLVSTFHAIEACGFPALAGIAAHVEMARAIRIDIWWRANEYMARIHREERFANAWTPLATDARRAICRLQGKTSASWWIDARNRPIESIFADLCRENQEMESGRLNC